MSAGKPAGQVTARRQRPAVSGRTGATWAAVTGTGAAGSAALAILVLVCAFIAVAVPRASLGYRTQVLQRIFRAASSSPTTILADAAVSGAASNHLSAAQLG